MDNKMFFVLFSRTISFILFCSFVLCPSNAFARREIPYDHLTTPVLITLEFDDNSTSTASGFFFNDFSYTYFVTAKHVLFSKKTFDPQKSIFKIKKATLLYYPAEEDDIGKFEMILDLQGLLNNNFIKFHPSHDIVVVRISEKLIKGSEASDCGFVKKMYYGKKSSPKHAAFTPPLAKTFDKVNPGNAVIVFGYPSSIGLKNMPQFDYEKPLLRRGMIAGKYTDKKTIIIDAPVYYGNSGGPVIEIEEVALGEVQYRIIGVVTELVPFVELLENKTMGYTNLFMSNSGYSVVEPIDTVLDLIQK